MLSFKLSAGKCANRIVTLQSLIFRLLARFVTACAIGGLAFAFCGVQAETTPLSQQMKSRACCITVGMSRNSSRGRTKPRGIRRASGRARAAGT